MKCKLCPKDNDRVSWRPVVGLYLCADCYHERMMSLRPSRYITIPVYATRWDNEDVRGLRQEIS